MNKWIIKADIYRYRKELTGLNEGPKRQRLLDRLSAAEAVLAREQFDELVRETSNA